MPNTEMPELLAELLNLETGLREKTGLNDAGKLDYLLFLCDRESFLSNNSTIFGNYCEVDPNLRYVALKNGIRLFYRDVPWREMADLALLMAGRSKPEKFDESEFSAGELEIIREVAHLGLSHPDPLDWLGKSLATQGEGSAINFEGFENAMFDWGTVKERRETRACHNAGEKIAEMLSESIDDPKKSDFSDTYRIINLRDPLAGIILRQIFRDCQFSFKSYPDREKTEYRIFRYGAGRSRRHPLSLDSAPDCENPWCVIKIEEDYPRILPRDSCFAGVKSLKQAKELILADVKEPGLWLVTLWHHTWQKEFYSWTAIPKIFENPARASKWLRENCEFGRGERKVELFIDGMNSACFEDLPGKEGYRIMKADRI